MFRLSLSVCFYLLICSLNATGQFIYGQCSVGGTFGDGVFFGYDIGTGLYRQVHHCGVNYCSQPGNALVAIPPD
jgi:hypothetical protein